MKKYIMLALAFIINTSAIATTIKGVNLSFDLPETTTLIDLKLERETIHNGFEAIDNWTGYYARDYYSGADRTFKLANPIINAAGTYRIVVEFLYEGQQYTKELLIQDASVFYSQFDTFDTILFNTPLGCINFALAADYPAQMSCATL